MGPLRRFGAVVILLGCSSGEMGAIEGTDDGGAADSAAYDDGDHLDASPDALGGDAIGDDAVARDAPAVAPAAPPCLQAIAPNGPAPFPAR